MTNERTVHLFADLTMARRDGRYPRPICALGGVKLLILDDWGSIRSPRAATHPLKVVDDRYGCDAAVITSQIPGNRRHDLIGDPTIADAILDRLVHTAHRLKLRGDSLRKKAVTNPEA